MKKIVIKIKPSKIRRPVAKKPNTIIKSKKDYNRKEKHKKIYVEE